ncbi:PREDICTED: transmembrane protein 156 [Elephantulus edwardii]|uniref:transmembrane protein 156 n=1 Tax=Elephantulus edwardii TaxID=28737 RepID=UPI0003F0B8D5|nr:PREDICTED: transmembrane protein 156 [Elephantulus edwardii]
MTKTALLKLCVAILITIILILPEYFKTPKEDFLELSCLEACLQTNLTYLLSSLNVSFLTLLQPVREAQLIRGIFLNYSHFENISKILHNIRSEFQDCSSCLVCECKGNMDFISPEQTSKVLVMSGSVYENTSDFHLPCQHLNVTVTSIVDHLDEHDTTCHLNNHSGNSTTAMQDPTMGKSKKHSCRVAEDLNSCVHISLHLKMDAKNFMCSMKITWYILVLLVFILIVIFITLKIREGHWRVQKWQRRKNKPVSVLLRESDSEKLRALNVQVISDAIKTTSLNNGKFA